jgi:heavy metal sensor kinase
VIGLTRSLGLSIRWRLTFWNAAVMTALLTAFSVVLLVSVRRHLIARADQVLMEELRELIEEISFYPDTDHLAQQLERRYAVHAHYHFQVSREDGSVLFRSRFLTFITLPAPGKAGELRGSVFEDIQLGNLGPHRLLTMAMRDSRAHPMLLQALAPRAALDMEFRSYVWLVLGIGPLAIGLAVLSGYGLARGSLAPIEGITATAERISADNLTERIRTPNPSDELGRLAATLNRTFDGLQSSINDMRQFTADAAHELRSPLAVMKTEAEVVLRSARSADDYRRAIEVTLEETTRLSAMVDQLLALSRNDAGFAGNMDDIVPMDALLGDVVERFYAVAVEKGLTLVAEPLPPWFVHGDDIWLSQLFYNLLDNAMKYTEAPGQVTLSAVIEDNVARFTVENTGAGIAAEHLPHLFKRFYRVDDSRTRAKGGTGLGLAICKSIAELHGGSIKVESSRNTGTRFIVTLPGSTSDSP